MARRRERRGRLRRGRRLLRPRVRGDGRRPRPPFRLERSEGDAAFYRARAEHHGGRGCAGRPRRLRLVSEREDLPGRPEGHGSRESRHGPRRAEGGRDLGACVREGRNALRRHGEQGPRLSQDTLGRPRALSRNRGRAREGARRGSRRHRVRGHVGPRSRGRAARSGQPAHAARFLAPGGFRSRRGRPRCRVRGGIAARGLDGPAGAGRAGPSAHAHADAGALGARGGASARLRVGVRFDVFGAAFRRAPFHEQLGNRRHSARRLRRARLALSRGVDFRPASRRGRSAPRRDGPARARVRVEGPPRAPRGLDR